MKELFIPYRERRHPVWPNGAKLDIGVNVAIEAWDWDAIEHDATESSEHGGYSHGPKLAPRLLGSKPDLAITTTIEYGYRVGIYRLMDIWDELKVTPTVVSSGLAIDLHPELFRELAS